MSFKMTVLILILQFAIPVVVATVGIVGYEYIKWEKNIRKKKSKSEY